LKGGKGDLLKCTTRCFGGLIKTKPLRILKPRRFEIKKLKIPLAPFQGGVLRIAPQKLGWKGCFNFSFFTPFFFGKQDANPP
jgi:hypothetical protein